MKVYKAHVFGDEPTVMVQTGERVTLDGQDYVRSAGVLIPADGDWHKTEADALIAAAPKASAIADRWSDFVRRLQEGRR